MKNDKSQEPDEMKFPDDAQLSSLIEGLFSNILSNIENKDDVDVPEILSDGKRLLSTSIIDGQIVIDVSAPVRIRSTSDLSIECDGSMITASKGDTVQFSSGEHHVQPTNPAYFDSVMLGAVSDKWRDEMAVRHIAYDHLDTHIRRRMFYASAFRKNLMRRPKRSGCGCGR